MPKTVALNGFFPYLRHQSVNAVRSARGSSTPVVVGPPQPPVGFGLLLGADGAYLKGVDGAYLYGRSA